MDLVRVIFACNNCRIKEIKRVKSILEEKNRGKGTFSKKEKMNLNPDNFMRDASEVIFMKNSQVDRYGDIKNNWETDNSEYEAHGGVSIEDGWKFKCLFCGHFTQWDRGFGNL